MPPNKSTVAVQAFWKQLRKGKHVLRRDRRVKKRPGVVRFTRHADPRVPSALAAHRAAIEHDVFRGDIGRRKMMRAAAKEYDAWFKANADGKYKARHQRGAGERSGGFNVQRRPTRTTAAA